jgi:succinoglycan biosynthesis protein ExoH
MSIPKHLMSIFADRLHGNHPTLTQAQLSRTISFARIALIVGLVFLHYVAYPNASVSPFDGMDARQYPVATFANSFVLFFFFSAVPLLSMVSGWLFFSFEADEAVHALFERIRKRIGSLYLPLVAWNLLYLALAVIAFAGWPGNAFLAALDFQPSEASPGEYANAVFALTGHPLAFQFWFVRDLLVTVLVSPLLWLALRHAPYAGMAVLGVAWLVGHDLFIFFRTDVAFFFYLGGFLRMKKLSLEIGRGATVLLVLVYVALVILRSLAPLAIDMDPARPQWLDAATRAMRPIGVLACWGLCLRLAATRIGGVIAQYGGLSFFMFATHFPLIAGVKQLLWPLLPWQSDGWLIAHYVASVTVTVAVGLGAGLTLAHFAPGVFAWMNGGRLVPVVRPEPWGASVPRGA